MGGGRNMVMKYGERLLLWESGCGRKFGWDVELDGKRIAILSRPRGEDMFWVSYEAEAVAEDATVAGAILELSSWIENDSRLVFRNRGVKGAVAGFVVAGRIDAEARRIMFRGLYADVKRPQWWVRFVQKLKEGGRGMMGRRV